MNGYERYGYDSGPPRRNRSYVPPIMLLLAGGLLVAVLYRFSQHASNPDNIDAEPREITPHSGYSDDETRTIEVFERCSQSVVYVSPMARVRRSLFGFYDVVETGTGSGFVWDEEGHVVTNFHVILKADECQVTLPDNTTYEASLVGAWPDKDLAVLHISAPRDKLVPISVGTSRDLRVGQRVLAIGNPFGLDSTLTTGVVSALNREITAVSGRTIQGVIQTDAAINPGNSGGPLLDSAGRLIGINTAIYSRTGASAGIGFAVPVDIINSVVPQLIAHGKVIRPGLGIEPANDALARRLGVDNGVLILAVSAGSGAELAGLRPTSMSRDVTIALGDVILKVGETDTPNLDALLNALEQYRIGDTVEVTVGRLEKIITLPITLQAIQ